MHNERQTPIADVLFYQLLVYQRIKKLTAEHICDSAFQDILSSMEPSNIFTIRQLTPDDRPWVSQILTDQWGSSRIVTRGVVHQAECLPGFVSELDGQKVGLITYHIQGDECEIVSLNSFSEQIGIATALIEQVKSVTIQAGLRRLWLITTNDNLAALRFYQKRCFQLVAVYAKALEVSRQLKPEIPLIGLDGIPLHDEIELELTLTD